MKVNFNRAKAHSFMSKMLCSVMIASAIFAFASCDDSKHPSALVGSWGEDKGCPVMEYGSSSNGQRKVETYRTIELLKDGKAIDNGSVTTWEVSDKCLFIGNKVYNYEVSNSKLQLTDGSKTVSFIKMN